jgi:cyclophilin family peptidyl-prolyl cis-trans isomerase
VANNPKRARQKARRAELRQQREVELRRRRMLRVAGTLAALAGIAILAVWVIAGFGSDAGGGGGSGAQEQSEGQGAAEEASLPEGCDDTKPPANDARQYDRPEQVTEPGVDYRAELDTSCGTIEIDLLEEQAPETVNNFVFLAREGYYDGLTFHRVIRNFVIQGGDPAGDGSGGPGYQFHDELPEKSSDYTFGAVAMANSGPNTNGSQFFIVTHDTKKALEGGEKLEPAGLQALYSLFGEATEDSYEVIDRISSVETSTDEATRDRPLTPIYINSVKITEA